MGENQRDRWDLRPTKRGNSSRSLSENAIHPPGEPESERHTAFDIVAIAASAGGLNALSHILSGLPSDFAAAIAVVQHLDPRHRSLIAVVLTGSGSDGTMGVRAIKKMKGTVIAQDEASSEFFGMPGSAIDTKNVDFILPLDEIAPALVTLVRGDRSDRR